MPAYSFKEQFIEPIKLQIKRQTIRGKRKHQAKPGDTIYIYYGMRTKHCKKIGEGFCNKVDEVAIDTRGDVFVNGKKLSKKKREHLAWADGFINYFDMFIFWQTNNTLPFVGDIIYWTDFQKA